MEENNNKPQTEQCNLHIVSGSAYDWKTEQAKGFCRNRECPFYDGWNYGCKQRSDAEKCAARQHY